MAILAIALVAVFQSQSQSISMASQGRFLTTAALLAQDKMAEYDKKDPKLISSADGDFGADFEDYTWRIEISDTGFVFLKKIDLVVTNNKMATHNVYQLELYKIIQR